MAYGKDAAPIASQTSFTKRNYLDSRVERWGGARADALAIIVDLWFALGCPPLNKAETHMAPLPIPLGARVELPPYWTDLVPFDVAEEGESQDAAKAEAARLLKRPRKGNRASEGEHHSNRA